MPNVDAFYQSTRYKFYKQNTTDMQRKIGNTIPNTNYITKNEDF